MNTIVSTHKLKELLSKAVKGASCNKMLPLTSLVGVHFSNNVITLTTTDGNNYLQCVGDCSVGELSFVVDINLLNSLTGKISTREMEITKTDKCVIVKANGTYKIELPVDEAGNEIVFPNPFASFSGTQAGTISEECYRHILKSNGSALASSLATPCYTGYYFGDRVLTTDSYKICCNDYKLVDTPVLFSADTMKLLDLCHGEITLQTANDNAFMLSNNNIFILGRFMQGIEEFNADAIINLVDKEFEYKAEFDRQPLLNLLGRISLFVSPFDKNNITLHFTSETLEVTSLQSNSKESIKYAFQNDVFDFTCTIDIVTLIEQLSCQSGTYVEIWYGEKNAIKLVDGDTTQVVALSAE